ncbi:hypothetical protein ACFY3O_28635 [Streptomyces sp. NPDC001046]|uniref:hypothetical protein n=1 Tax=Streptomyces sp. NPDC001046 TaxID=3364543 RepID=UPI0036A6F9C7
MPEAQDPLRSLFEDAARSGRERLVPVPVSDITARGRRAQRRRLAWAVAVCLVLSGGGAAAAVFLPGDPAPTGPATTPSVESPPPSSLLSTGPPSPTPTPTITPTTKPPSAPRTTVPPPAVSTQR